MPPYLTMKEKIMDRIELPNGYAFVNPYGVHCPFHLQKDGEAVEATSKYNQKGWIYCFFNEGDEKRLYEFAAAMNAPAEELARLKAQLEVAKEALKDYACGMMPVRAIFALDDIKDLKASK